MRNSSSRRSYSIRTFFDALVRYSECQSSRPMAIKMIRPGKFGSNDEIIYECARCGAETSKSAE
jgi:hypothetical protein